MASLKVLHAIHDFLPRHRAGSEIYLRDLAVAQLGLGADPRVLCAEYDPSRPHGELTRRVQDGLPVLELVNNWAFQRFSDTWAPPLLTRRLAEVLDAERPDVLHVHNLLDLSLELPALARARGIPVVATLHDYTLFCPSGGQRVHLAEEHICHAIQPARCARCFSESPFARQIAAARLLPQAGGPRRLAGALARRFPAWAASAAELWRRGARPAAAAPTRGELEERLARARAVLGELDLVVAPSAALAEDYLRLGLAPARLEVRDYGFVPLPRRAPRPPGDPLRLGFVGTLAWHKGVHVLLEAVARLPAARYQLEIRGRRETFPDYTARLERLAAGLPVRFLGGFDDAERAAAYRELDLLVVPSLWPENSPLVIHEALQVGVPVLGARSGGIPDLVRHGVDGLLYGPANSPKALAAVLSGVLEAPGRLTELAAAQRPVSSIDDDARAWLEAYGGFVARRGAR